MTDNKSKRWYSRQMAHDENARRTAESLLGTEANAFAESMANIVACLDDAQSQGDTADLAGRYKLAIATFSFNLIWSSWSDALAGRYAPASVIGRFVSDSCEFLLGLRARPTLAKEIELGDLKVEAMRRAVRDAVNSATPNAGTKWASELEEGKKVIQQFAHVSMFSVKSDWATTSVTKKKVGIFRPGGVLTRDALRGAAVMLAICATELLKTVLVAFPESPASARARLAAEKSAIALDGLLRANKQSGALDSLFFLSGERYQNTDGLNESLVESAQA